MSMKKFVAVVAAVITATGMVGCSVDRSKPDAAKQTIRIAYQTFPSGDLIVKNNKWLEQALPDYNIKWTNSNCSRTPRVAYTKTKHCQTCRSLF